MRKKSFLSGKKFLITQPMIRSFCGSTMVALELADYLISIGAEVTVYTNIAFPPALPFFEGAGVKVVSSRDEYNWALNDYDYVWVHSLTFPRQLLEELKHPPKKMPAFIFLHMSPLESIPDEHPWIYNLENSLSALSLYISDITLESNEKYGLPSKVGFFRNPAPIIFKSLSDRGISPTLRKILIVSNHPPEEVLEARRLLINAGIHVDIYGEGRDRYAPISPNILRKYNAVITIGKTVQYCIVGSLPVYIYDWFGGHGWLTESNYELSKARNFSGRGFPKKTGNEIAQEILDDYSKALDYHLKFLAEKKDEFIIDKVLDNLLDGLRPRKIESLDSEYIESAKAAVGCAEIRFIASEELGDAYKRCDDLAKQCDDLVKQRDDLVKRLEECRGQLDAVSNSKRMKLLNAILKPHDKVKDVFKK